LEVLSRLVELSTIHPRLLWDDLIAATVAVLGQNNAPPPFRLELAVEGLPAFDDDRLLLAILPDDVSPEYVARLRRTYEASRLVEMAAIAIAGLAIFHAAHREIRDIALRGSRADYLVGEAGQLLEVGGRSRGHEQLCDSSVGCSSGSTAMGAARPLCEVPLQPAVLAQ